MIYYEACNDNDVFVSLTDEEYEEAKNFGKFMYEHSQKQGYRDYRKFVRKGVDGQRVQELGSIAERAVAKACGIEWTAWVDTFKKPDLHHNIEVRLIGVDRYGLRVYDRDHDTRRVVGIVIEKGKEREPYRIPGWINAKYAKKDIYRMDPLGRGKPMYSVPQNKLRSLESLLEFIKKETTPTRALSAER
jgi:hypothetical protein